MNLLRALAATTLLILPAPVAFAQVGQSLSFARFR